MGEWNTRSAPAQCALPDLIREYARDLRRNSSAGDDYPWEWAKATADYLETLIERASALSSTERRDDLGIVLSALRFHEEATGEKFDDEDGVIAEIERDHAALSSNDRSEV